MSLKFESREYFEAEEYFEQLSNSTDESDEFLDAQGTLLTYWKLNKKRF